MIVASRREAGRCGRALRAGGAGGPPTPGAAGRRRAPAPAASPPLRRP